MPATVKRPFWLHQLAEYIIGLAAIATGFQSPRPAVPAIMGGLVLLNAAIADGPFGAFRWVNRRHHRWADWMVLVVMVVLTALPGVDLSTRLVHVALVVVFAVVILGTNYTEPIKRRTRVARETETAGETGTAVDFGRRAGRITGSLAATVRDRMRKSED